MATGRDHDNSAERAGRLESLVVDHRLRDVEYVTHPRYPRSWAGSLRAMAPGLGPLVTVVTAAVLFSRRLFDPSILQYDADRIRMDGVFLLDFLRALPLDRVYEFTTRYYAQYPVLSIGYRPPGFPVVEALFNAIFGVNVWSSRLALLPFAAVGITAWYRLVRRLFDGSTAFWATLLLCTTPFLVQWGWYTMNDLPVLFVAMLLADLFHRSTESADRRYVYGSAFVFVVAVWTKQTAVFLPLWFLLYLAVTRRLRSYLGRREVWVAVAVSLLLLMPLAVFTLWVGGLNIAQSVGVGPRADPAWRVQWRNLALYPLDLAKQQLPLPALLLSFAGMGAALWRRDRRLVYFALLISSTYAFFTYLVAKDGRYTLFWLPAFTVFAAVPLCYLARYARARILYATLLVLVTASQVAAVYARTPQYATGYRQAAEWVVRHRASPMVLFDGVTSGTFAYFVRALDADRSIFVLRGDKLLTSSMGSKAKRLQVHVRSREEIQDLLDRYGVVHVVVERYERSTVAIHHTLREFLWTGPFELVHEIPVDTNRELLQGQTLQIYRYLTPRPPSATQIELRVPLVDRTFTVPLSPSPTP